MMKADEVEAMLRLGTSWAGGRGTSPREFGCSRNTVKRYVEARGFVSYGGCGPGRQAGGSGRVAGEASSSHHRGKGDVVRQDLESAVPDRGGLSPTVDRAVAPFRRLLARSGGEGDVPVHTQFPTGTFPDTHAPGSTTEQGLVPGPRSHGLRGTHAFPARPDFYMASPGLVAPQSKGL